MEVFKRNRLNFFGHMRTTITYCVISTHRDKHKGKLRRHQHSYFTKRIVDHVTIYDVNSIIFCPFAHFKRRANNMQINCYRHIFSCSAVIVVLIFIFKASMLFKFDFFSLSLPLKYFSCYAKQCQVRSSTKKTLSIIHRRHI